MAWTTPLTAVANAALTAAQWNASVRDNLNETAPAKISAAGQIIVGTAANAITARTPAEATVNAGESTTSTSFVDLTTPGPAVTVTTGATAYIAVSALHQNNTAGAICLMGCAVSGASSIAANDALATQFESATTNHRAKFSYGWLQTGLTPGSNTFTAKYRVASNTGTFTTRRLTVIPLS